MGPDKPETGKAIALMAKYLADRQAADLIPVFRTDIEAWLDAMVTAAAMLDPDNPPLTAEQLARLKPRSPNKKGPSQLG